MPKRTDIRKILILGSGPIVIGQACEFDYSGTQACKALRSEGYEVVLVNSNPATIMTDPELADRTYVEPLTPDSVRAVVERERPDAILPTVGGQTALNLAVALSKDGSLSRLGVELIGAKLEAIEISEDRLLFKKAMEEIGLSMPLSGYVKSMEEARATFKKIAEQLPDSGPQRGYPLIIRPSFTLGGSGGGIAFNDEEFEEIVSRALAASPVHETMI
jgi:carbamoyl-phosphate synthase large subunit